MVGIAVAAFLASISMMIQKDEISSAEDRLSILTNNKHGKSGVEAEVSLLSKPLGDSQGAVEEWINNSFNIQRLLDQADMRMTVLQFAGLCIGGAVISFVLLMFTGLPIIFIPIVSVIFLVGPSSI